MAIERVIGVSFTPLDQPRDRERLATAILRFYEECGLRPDRVDQSEWRKARDFTEKTFRQAMMDPAGRQIYLWADLVPELNCFLRPSDPLDQEFETRWAVLVSTRLPCRVSEPVHRLMEAITRLYPISHGSVGGYRSAAYAAQECCHSGAYSPLELDPDTRARLDEDQMCRRFVRTKLRRLYPVTIIGPDLWAQLPPMPSVDPAPRVEDLGNCKMLTVWPELVEPRDPAFLAGTKELRRWLWPYTIQNPADAIGLD